MEQATTNKKQRVGIVTSNKMDKTITVSIQRRLKHPIYGKFVKKSKKFLAHDETNEANEGDIVKIIEHRPLSRRKRWKLVEIVEKAK
jgi:small subunit ribosomal protein S17